MVKLNEGVALVTGGSSGIGAELCKQLAQQGMCIAVADINFARASEVSDLIGDAARPYQADVTSRQDMDRLADLMVQDFGGLNLLCANAGVVMPLGNVINRDQRDWEFVLSVNLFGVVNTVDAFIGLLRNAKDHAHIMITASMGGVLVGGHLPLGPYSVSKFACVGYGEELKLALADEKIGVSLLCPGLIDTPIADTSSETRPKNMGTQEAPTRQGISPRLRPTAMLPEQVAQVALQGLWDDRFYIPTHNTAGPRLKAHFEKIVDEVSGQGATPGI